MITNGHQTPSVGGLARKTLGTVMGALQNRGELFMVELQEEKGRLIRLMVFGLGGLFLGMVTLLLLTGTIIFLVPEEYRIYAAGGFTVLYLAGTIAVIFRIKSMMKLVPFSDSLTQLRKDREILDPFE